MCLRINCSFSSAEIVGSLAASITRALTAALDFGAIVTSGTALSAVPCARPLPNPNPQAAISNDHRHIALNFAISLTYAVLPHRCKPPIRAPTIAI